MFNVTVKDFCESLFEKLIRELTIGASTSLVLA